MNICIFSGELSGDLIGGALALKLRQLVPDVQMWGLGSGAMRSAGVDIVADSAAWGAISITEAVVKVPLLLMKMSPMLKKELKRRKPDVMVLIDFGAFNVRAARYAKAHGIKVVYYFPPGSWRRTGGKGAELAQITDLLACPFRWTEERYRLLGANAVYVGHPLVERVHSEMSREEFAGHFGMDPDRPIIGLLPGSRTHEVSHLMPTLLESAKRISRKIPNAQYVIGVAPTISLEMMRSYLTEHTELRDRLSELWHEFTQEAETKVWKPVKQTAKAFTHQTPRQMVTVGGVIVSEDVFNENQDSEARSQANRIEPMPPTVLAKGMIYEVMRHSDVLLTCSGTATLEAALFETPMIILYRGSKIMEIEYYLRGINKKVTHIGLPNILAERRIVPELIQRDATPEAISELALQMLLDVQVRSQIKQDLRSIRLLLGDAGASERTAQLVVNVIQGKPIDSSIPPQTAF